MTWQTVASINTRYGYTHLQYDDSSTGSSRSCRVRFELNSGSSVNVNFYNFTVNGNNLGTKTVTETATLWEGSLPAGDRTVSYYCNWYDIGRKDYSGTGNIPARYTPPTGLGINNIVCGVEDFKANVYLTGWGVNSGGTKYRELQVWTKGMVEPRRYQPQNGSNLSGNITTNNSSSGNLTIVGNTEYTLGAYASNGNEATGSQNMGNYTTRAYAPTLSVDTLGEDNVVIAYSTRADGGKYTKSVQYSLDGGATWVTGATVNTSSASSGTFTISGLTDDTEYTLKCRVSTSAGETDGADIVFRTLESHKLYGPVGGVSKKTVKWLGSVGDLSKYIIKIYGSENGVTKRIF